MQDVMQSRSDLGRLDQSLQRFRDHPIVHLLRRFLLEATDEELFHIDLSALARQWDVSRRTVMELFLRSVRFGILDMEWAFHCPTCGGVAKESLKLAHTHEQEFCPVCRVDFKNTLDDNVEVFFSVSREIRPIGSNSKEAYERAVVEAIENEGRYDWRADSTVRGVEVLNHPVFREIFGEDTLSLDQSLEIQSATILFTDVTGSTSLYERLGDARAYRLIRDHFDLVFSAIAEEGGLPIKTIGDAVMGVFDNEAAAVRAAFRMNDALAESNIEGEPGSALRLKIGIHRGPVIVVTLNNRIDYFGRTVNIAARTQGVSGPQELTLLDEVLRAPGVQAAIKERVNRVKRGRVEMKGIEGPVTVYRIPLHKE